ncbi:DUF1102 domain-containing protein [Halopiger aswanensis]|uniref:Uncharacterized protein DUF1102 n=1 Tax=Halopiger aswanensis TaxID=148449 RepID=A0A419WKA2_9EURY|nr:DUF1102 domain-containing protein [Halopiger aswanensis]RKD95822.1 uncharacterized protein DUF1102 [Halopiger aswanensis]
MSSATTSRWLVLGFLAIGLVCTGAVATDAGLLSAADEPEVRTGPHEHDNLGNDTGVVAEPHDGPNGAYAYLDGDGQLVIDLTIDNDALEGDGISAGAVTGIDDVVALRNAGNESAKVWLEHDAANVTFRTGEGDSIEGANDAAVLEPEESISIGFVVDARNLEAGEAVIESLRFRTTALEHGDKRDSSSDSSASAGTNTSPSSPSPAVEVVEPDSKTRTVTVSGGRGRTVPIDLGSLRVGKGVILEGVTIQFGDIEDSTLEIRADRDRKTGDGLPADVATVGAVTVEDAPAATAIESVEYRFTVDRDRFADRASPSADDSTFEFYSRLDGTWEHHAFEAASEIEPGEGDEPTGTDRYTATVTTDSLKGGIVAGPNATDASSEGALESNGDSDGSGDDGVTTGDDDTNADSGPSERADGSGSQVGVSVVGLLALIASLRKRARG